ncbi:dipeptidase 1 (renal) [Entophlyctis luteolus]|nr:dipeptidase 1 (renal) [Entophlyctis luteolus]
MDAALRILKRAPIIDTHNDWPIALKGSTDGILAGLDLNSLPEEIFRTDITRLRKGMVGAQFWSAYVGPCVEYHFHNDFVVQTLDQIDLIKRIVNNYPKECTFELAKTVRDIRKIAKKGKIASLIGVEGAHQIDGSMGALRLYYELGVRYMTLTHSCHSAWADSCEGNPLHNGLTADGFRFIREMNRLGMMVDISHVSPATMRQAILHSQAPVLFSHSAALAKTPVPRNVPDDILQMLQKHDGVVMVAFVDDFVRINGSTTVTVKDLADHISHIREVCGAAHIGVGADFDGARGFALKDVSKYPELIAELVERNFSTHELVGITGGNLLRVMERTEAVARAMQAAGEREEERGVPVAKQCAQ